MTPSRAFRWLWLAVTVSLLGSQLSGFALGVAVYGATRSTTLYALLGLATLAPQILLAPFAGVLVDRFDRRRVLLFGQAGAGACSLALCLLHLGGALGLPAMLALQAAGSACLAAQFPAVSSSTALLVPKERLGRASGLGQLGPAVAQIAAPGLAGFLVGALGLGAILAIDFATFVFAAAVMALLPIPRAAAPRGARKPFFAELAHGWRYLRRRHGLLALLILFAALNLALGAAQVLIAPLVLGFADARALGLVLSTGGLGMLAGSGVMLAWGGPRRRVAGVLAFALVQGLFFLLGAARPSALLVGAGAFGVFFAAPLLEGTNEVLWQRKVPPSLHGRVFSFRATIPRLTVPIAWLGAGPLADRVFAPLLLPDGALASSAGRLLGVGPGRGVALLFALLGVVIAAFVALGWRYPRLRRLEDELPDLHQPATAQQRAERVRHAARQPWPEPVHQGLGGR